MNVCVIFINFVIGMFDGYLHVFLLWVYQDFQYLQFDHMEELWQISSKKRTLTNISSVMCCIDCFKYNQELAVNMNDTHSLHNLLPMCSYVGVIIINQEFLVLNEAPEIYLGLSPH